MIDPATSASVPVSRAMRGPEVETRSTVMAAVTTAIIGTFMSPATTSAAIGAEQLNVHSTPSWIPSRHAVATFVESAGIVEWRHRANRRAFHRER